MNRRLIAAVGLAFGLGTIAPLAIAADPTSTPFYDRDQPGLVNQSPLPPDNVQDARDAASSTPIEVQAAPAPSSGEVYVAPALSSGDAVVTTPADDEVVSTAPADEEAASTAPADEEVVSSAPVEEDVVVSTVPAQEDVYVAPPDDERWTLGRSTVVNGEVVRPHTGAVEEEGHLVLTFPSRGAGTAEGYSP